jgi:hypothetical protein
MRTILAIVILLSSSTVCDRDPTCEDMIDRAMALCANDDKCTISHDNRESGLAECKKSATPAQLKCAIQADTVHAMTKCLPATPTGSATASH